MAVPLTGVVPVVPTIFHDDGTVDLGGTARVVDYLMDAGADGLCLLASYSGQFSLTDAERNWARPSTRPPSPPCSAHHRQQPGRRLARAQARRLTSGRG